MAEWTPNENIVAPKYEKVRDCGMSNGVFLLIPITICLFVILSLLK